MSFNNGNERRKLNAKWEHLRVQYREAGMSEDAIQAMYEFDLGVLNSERAYITNTMTVSGVADDGAAKETSDFKQYEKAVTVTDTYHETKTRFAWVGEVQNERLHTRLEKLSDEDLKLQALALSGSGLYGFVNGKRPGKTECKDHYGFQHFSNHFRCHAFIPLKLNFRNALCKKF